MRVIGIVMREVDQSTLVVPDVLAMHGDVIANCDRDALADVDVVVDKQGLRRIFDLHDEALMRARWAGVIREQPRDRAVGVPSANLERAAAWERGYVTKDFRRMAIVVVIALALLIAAGLVLNAFEPH